MVQLIFMLFSKRNGKKVYNTINMPPLSTMDGLVKNDGKKGYDTIIY